jgi:phosphohistidine phosphatase
VAIVLDLLRHGHAIPPGPDGDRGRRLSPEGIRSLGALADLLATEGWRPDHTFSSPLARAQESAEILLRSSASPSAMEAVAVLEPDAEPAEILEALASRGITTGHVLIVGHQPLLGRLVGLLTGAERGLSPGMLIRVHCPRGASLGGGRVVRTFGPEDLVGA